jgi:hypothetical protein
MTVATEKKSTTLKKMPGFTSGLLADSALRMIKLARPICPNSKIKVELDANGRIIPVDTGADPNCQRAGGEWWIACETKGHNPYFTTRVWYTKHDKLGQDEDGDTVVVGTKMVKHEEKYPNMSQVAISPRVNSGKGAVDAIAKKGFKRVGDIGYEEVCQMRNCQKPVSPKFKSRQYGDYCSVEHLQLIAADRNGIMLVQTGTGLDTGLEEKTRGERNKQLREAAWASTDGGEV